MDTSPVYGTVTLRADQINPRATVLDEQIVMHLIEQTGVSFAVLGTSDEIIAACARVAAAAADSEEPRVVLDDIPPHPEPDTLDGWSVGDQFVVNNVTGELDITAGAVYVVTMVSAGALWCRDDVADLHGFIPSEITRVGAPVPGDTQP